MPTARRILFGTYIAPTQSLEMEEDSLRKTTFQASPNGTLGGKGTALIDATQWNDGWTSMAHSQVNWEDLDDTDDATGNRWEDSYDLWSGELDVTTTSMELTGNGDDLGFLYIKNTGDTYNVVVSLNGSGGPYYIKIPPNGSVHLRGGSTSFNCDQVYVGKESSSTTIEYIIAKITP